MFSEFLLSAYDACHEKIDLFRVKKIEQFLGLETCVKSVLFELFTHDLP